MSHPLDTPFSSRQIYLDSDDGYHVGGNNADCLFYFHEHIIAPQGIQMLISVVNLVIPISWYLIDDTNQTLTWSLNGVNQSDITITNGNYSATQLESELNTLFGGAITVEFNDISDKFIFTHASQNFVFQSSSTCLSLLGFSAGNHSSVNNQLTSDRVVDLSGIKTISLRSGNLHTSNMDSRSQQQSNILAKIPVNLSQGSILVWTNKFQFRSRVMDKVINYFRLSLVDHDNAILNLNSIEWSCVLQIDFQQERRYIPQHITMKAPTSLKEVIAQELGHDQNKINDNNTT